MPCISKNSKNAFRNGRGHGNGHDSRALGFDMRIFAATWFEDNKGQHLTAAGVKLRLVSYHKLRMDGHLVRGLPIYVKTGIIPPVAKGEKNAGK